MPASLTALQQTLLGAEHLLLDGTPLPCAMTDDGTLWLATTDQAIQRATTPDQQWQLSLSASNSDLAPVRLRDQAIPFAIIQARQGQQTLESPQLALPWPATRGAAMVQHMNEDHGDALKHYFLLQGQQVTEARLLSLDPFGMWLCSGHTLLRFPFPAPANDPAAVRDTLVALARTPTPA